MSTRQLPAPTGVAYAAAGRAGEAAAPPRRRDAEASPPALPLLPPSKATWLGLELGLGLGLGFGFGLGLVLTRPAAWTTHRPRAAPRSSRPRYHPRPAA